MFQPLDILVVCSAIGIGFIVAGLGVVLAKSRAVVISLIAAITVLTIIVSFLISYPAAIAESIILLGFVLCMALYHIRQNRIFASFRRALFRPIVSGMMLSIAGVSLVAAGSWRYDRLENSNFEDMITQVMNHATWHPTFETMTFEGKTDRGHSIPLRIANARPQAEVDSDEKEVLSGYQWDKRVINRGVATDVSNCHGWVFTGGKYWLFGSDVHAILEDNGYRPTRNPRPDDIIVYFKADGSDSIVHTGIVRAVGDVTIVESKWGWMGVYLHAAGESCYGTNYKFYHTTRTGHQLVNLKPDDAVIQTRPRSRLGFTRRVEAERIER